MCESKESKESKESEAQEHIIKAWRKVLGFNSLLNLLEIEVL
jgi:hypothetical protein